MCLRQASLLSARHILQALPTLPASELADLHAAIRATAPNFTAKEIRTVFTALAVDHVRLCPPRDVLTTLQSLAACLAVRSAECSLHTISGILTCLLHLVQAPPFSNQRKPTLSAIRSICANLDDLLLPVLTRTQPSAEAARLLVRIQQTALLLDRTIGCDGSSCLSESSFETIARSLNSLGTLPRDQIFEA